MATPMTDHNCEWLELCPNGKSLCVCVCVKFLAFALSPPKSIICYIIYIYLKLLMVTRNSMAEAGLKGLFTFHGRTLERVFCLRCCCCRCGGDSCIHPVYSPHLFLYHLVEDADNWRQEEWDGRQDVTKSDDYNVRPPSDVSWFRFAPVTIVIRTINHRYWSYKPA